MIGTTLKDRYIIAASLGIGGMGEVFLATDAQTDYQRVAIKMLEEHLARNREYLDRFQQEAILLRRLDHPNIVKHLDNFAIGGRYFIVMEYVEGDRVKDIVDYLDAEERQELFYLIGKTSGRLHGAGIIHGDLTTSNMIKREKNVVLIDFGLGEVSWEVEKRGVDLNLMYRMLTSTHFKYTDELFQAFKEGTEPKDYTPMPTAAKSGQFSQFDMDFSQ